MDRRTVDRKPCHGCATRPFGFVAKRSLLHALSDAIIRIGREDCAQRRGCYRCGEYSVDNHRYATS